jgi:hypothetical protein
MAYLTGLIISRIMPASFGEFNMNYDAAQSAINLNAHNATLAFAFAFSFFSFSTANGAEGAMV